METNKKLKYIPTQEELLMDIYWYKMELNNRYLKQEDKDILYDKIQKAEELFKNIKK